jgi:hypothetical protein
MSELTELQLTMKNYDLALDAMAQRINVLEFAAQASAEHFKQLITVVSDLNTFGCRMDAARRKEAGILGGK